MTISFVLNRLARRCGIALLYETRAGVKGINQLIHSENVHLFWSGSSITVDGSQLRLGVDGLRDELTLLGASIAESPHFQLMSHLARGLQPTGKLDYLRRLRAGSLDFRPARPLSQELIDELQMVFERRSLLMASGDVCAVYGVRVGENVHIVDGKHSAALAHLLEKKVECRLVSTIMADSYYQWIRRRMERRAARYQRHLDFFARVSTCHAHVPVHRRSDR